MPTNDARTTIIRKLLLGAVLLLAGVLGAPAAPGASVHVLCYHAFLERSDPFSFSVEALERQVALYQSRGFRFVSMKDLADGTVTGGNNVLVTVDDGNRSFLAAWERVFKPNNIRPLLAIFPAIIGKQPYAFTWDELIALSEHCDIAAHGWYHLRLDEKLYRTNRADFEREIIGSKKVLEEKLGRPVTVFIYAGGYRSEAAERVIRQAGYRYAFTIEQGGIELPIEGRYDPLRLPRYMLTKSDWRTSIDRVARNYIRRPWTDGPAVASRRVKEASSVPMTPVPVSRPASMPAPKKDPAPPVTLARASEPAPIIVDMPVLDGTTAGDLRFYPDRAAPPRTHPVRRTATMTADERAVRRRALLVNAGEERLFDDGAPPAMIPHSPRQEREPEPMPLRPETLGLLPENLAALSPAVLAADTSRRMGAPERMMQAGFSDDYRKQRSKLKGACEGAIAANRRSYAGFMGAVKNKLRRAVDSWSRTLGR